MKIPVKFFIVVQLQGVMGVMVGWNGTIMRLHPSTRIVSGSNVKIAICAFGRLQQEKQRL
ncbi:hypothetical protein Leryth_017982 [Lithospermum erythrorhizon]|nr:hypothetical protein Leryth_017982 [Lithospermum erythrorhizon]